MPCDVTPNTPDCFLFLLCLHQSLPTNKQTSPVALQASRAPRVPRGCCTTAAEPLLDPSSQSASTPRDSVLVVPTAWCSAHRPASIALPSSLGLSGWKPTRWLVLRRKKRERMEWLIGVFHPQQRTGCVERGGLGKMGKKTEWFLDGIVWFLQNKKRNHG